MLFKACPRCKGDMHVNRDIYGDYKECLYCGFMEDIPNEDALLAAPAVPAAKKKRKVA